MPMVSRSPLHPLLVGVVDRLWCASPASVADVRVEWILPTCRAQVILSPTASVFVGAKVVGEMIERRTGDPMVGVSFVAGGSAALIGAQGDETSGITVPLDALMPVGSLPDQIAERGAGEALDSVEAELVKRLRPPPKTSLIVAAERAIRNGHPAAQIAELLGCDRRTLVPQFRRLVGVGPKHYERVCRFNRAVEAIRRPDAKQLASIAFAHGFADQAHLTREIHHFARTSPSRIHRDGADAINHIAPDKIFKT